MQGGHGDNYYYQLVANVRRYKGVAAPAPGLGRQDHRHRRAGSTSGTTSARSSPTTRATPTIATSAARAACTTPTRSGRNDLVADQGRPRREERLLLRQDPRARSRPARPKLDVAVDRRRPEPEDRLGRLRLHRQSDGRSRREKHGSKRTTAAGTGRRSRRSAFVSRATSSNWRSRATALGLPEGTTRTRARLQVGRQPPAPGRLSWTSMSAATSRRKGGSGIGTWGDRYALAREPNPGGSRQRKPGPATPFAMPRETTLFSERIWRFHQRVHLSNLTRLRGRRLEKASPSGPIKERLSTQTL